MVKIEKLAAVGLAVSPILYVSYAAVTGEYIPAVVIAAATLVFGLLGSLVAARRLFFLAGAAPHASLLAALIAVPVMAETGVPLDAATAAVGLLLIYTVGYAIHRGVDPDVATSVFVSVSASLSVVLAYVVASSYPLGFDITAVVFGDPLLAVRSEAFTAVAAALVVAALTLTTYMEQVYIGVDREAALLSGLNTRLYDAAFFTMLGLGVALLVRPVGFVLEHVLMLIPGAMTGYASSSRGALLVASATATLSGALGLVAAHVFNIAPAGASGLVLLLFYIVALLSTRQG